MPIRRLPAEALRDQLLLAGGTLSDEMGGPSVEIHLTAFLAGRGRPSKSGPLDGDGRRSLYLKVRRNFLPPFLTAFDFPVPLGTRGRRSRSNVPAQALTLLNDPFVIDQAQKSAEKLIENYSDEDERLEALSLELTGRLPSSTKKQAMRRFLQEVQSAASDDEEESCKQAWQDLTHTLMNCKESLFLF